MKAALENLEQAAVEQQCRALRLPAVAEQCAPLADVAAKQRQTYMRYLEALLAAELEERERNTIARRIKDARLPRMKTLEEFDFSKAPQVPATKMHELAQGGYIERAEPIILIGDCGTGKTHLLTGLCVAACRQKRRVRFATAAALVIEGAGRMEASWELKPYLEAMLMAADRPVTLEALAQFLDVTEQEIDAALQEFEADLLAADRGVQVRRRGRGGASR